MAAPSRPGSTLQRISRCLGVLMCPAQGFVDKPSDCDISAVLGMGFPAWRGGPLKHGDAVGAKTVLAKLQVC